MKRIASLFLIACLLLTLAACTGKKDKSKSEDSIYGTYKGTWDYYGDKIESNVTLKEDGTYTDVTYKNGTLVSTDTGDYEYRDGNVYCYDPNIPDHNGYIKYAYVNGTLENGGHTYQKQ